MNANMASIKESKIENKISVLVGFNDMLTLIGLFHAKVLSNNN